MKSIYNDRTKVLAPLVGGSDLSFRLLSRKYGAQVTFTEMVVSEYYLHATAEEGHRKYKNATRYEFDESDRPLILQLTGTEPESIIKMANLPMFEGKIDGLDINCGCPQGFALEKGYGAGLLRKPDNLVNMCKAIVANVKYPVSVKLRLEESVDHTINIMKRLKQVGVQAFTIHGRYYWQKGQNRGIADWSAIKRIKEEVGQDMVIVGNGNIGEEEDFTKIMKETGVDAGMAGYGALVNPSIFQSTQVSTEEHIRSYLEIARQHTNTWIDILRHTEWMLKNFKLPPLQTAMMFQTTNFQELCQFLGTISPPLNIKLDETKEDKTIYPVINERTKRRMEENIATKKKFKVIKPSNEEKKEEIKT